MERKRVWILSGASLGIVLLFLWGTFRGGTAAEIVPETVKEVPASVPLESEPQDGAAQKYDASTSLRDRPLRDPFRLAAPMEAKKSETMTTPQPSAPALPRAENPVPLRPLLRGTLVLGDDRRAMIDFGGQTVTVKEGEQVGTWQVTAISQRKVVLSGPAGDEVLSLS